MTKITIELPDDAPMTVLRDLADAVDCDLKLRPDGTYVARPRMTRVAASNVATFPNQVGARMMHRARAADRCPGPRDPKGAA